ATPHCSSFEATSASSPRCSRRCAASSRRARCIRCRPSRNTASCAAAGSASGASRAVTRSILEVGTPSLEMEKRIFLAIVISIALLWGWAALAPKLFPELAKKPVPTKPAIEKTTTAVPSATPAPAKAATVPAIVAAATAPVKAERVLLTVIDKPEYRAVLSNRGAELVSFKLKKYHDKHSKQPVELVKARETQRADYPFAVEASDPAVAARLNTSLWSVAERDERGNRVIEYRYSDGRLSATKTFRFTTDPYLFQFSGSISPRVPYRIAIGPGIRTLLPEEEDTRVVTTGNGIVEHDGKFAIIRREKGDRIRVFPSVEYIGIADNYFLNV